MKRLREHDANSPLLQKAQALLEAAPPLPESDARMQRIRRELDRPRGVWVALRRLPALAIALLIGLFGASAFAAVRIFDVISSAPSATGVVHDSVKPRHAKHAKHAKLVVAPAPEPQSVTTSIEPERARETSTHARPRVAASSQAQVAADSELVHRAVKALRRDHDPALAARLLQEHRAHSPAGPLAEEALSLQIEAALALQDARSRAFAREYVSRYPKGRYEEVAKRALEGTAP